MARDYIHEWQHNGTKIMLTGSGSFVVPALGLLVFWSLPEARAAIDKRDRDAASAQMRDIKLPVISADGQNAVIRGINTVNSYLIFEARSESYQSRSIYALSPAVRALIDRHVEITKEAAEILSKLAPCSIPTSYYGGNINEKLDALEAAYALALKNANAITE